MLQELRIADLGVIDEALIEPDPGFTVVTGETGAGKTMVVTALGLISGGRGDAGRVRAGADRASVEIRWAPSGGGADPSAEDSANVVSSGVNSVVNSVGGRFDEDGTLIAARTVGADGRSRAHVGGRAVPLATLSDLAEPLIAVHGQSEAISLLRPGPQRAVLDRFAGLTAEVTDLPRAARPLAAAGRRPGRPARPGPGTGAAGTVAAARAGRDRGGRPAPRGGPRAGRRGPPAGERRRSAGGRGRCATSP